MKMSNMFTMQFPLVMLVILVGIINVVVSQSLTEPLFTRGCRANRGQFPHETFCQQYYNCWDGRATIEECPGKLLFNPIISACDYPEAVNCGARLRNPEPAVTADGRCLKQFGVFPDQLDCTAFYKCSHGRAYRQICPYYTAFDERYLVCVHAYEVDCGGRGGIYGTLAPPNFNIPDGGSPARIGSASTGSGSAASGWDRRPSQQTPGSASGSASVGSQGSSSQGSGSGAGAGTGGRRVGPSRGTGGDRGSGGSGAGTGTHGTNGPVTGSGSTSSSVGGGTSSSSSGSTSGSVGGGGAAGGGRGATGATGSGGRGTGGAGAGGRGTAGSGAGGRGGTGGSGAGGRGGTSGSGAGGRGTGASGSSGATTGTRGGLGSSSGTHAGITGIVDKDISATGQERQYERPISPEATFRCPHPRGLYPNALDCSRFWLCREYKPSLLKCPTGQLFDLASLSCVNPEKAQCSSISPRT